jgi:hypothetical protein
MLQTCLASHSEFMSWWSDLWPQEAKPNDASQHPQLPRLKAVYEFASQKLAPSNFVGWAAYVDRDGIIRRSELSSWLSSKKNPGEFGEYAGNLPVSKEH